MEKEDNYSYAKERIAALIWGRLDPKPEKFEYPTEERKAKLLEIADSILRDAFGNAERFLAYQAINGERDYQDNLPAERKQEKERVLSVGEAVLLCSRYVRKAEYAWSDTPGDEKALHELRKIAAIAVNAMEYHGALPREIKEKSL